jgi:hypothetical protein
MEKRLRVNVAPGMFQSERTVSFEAGGHRYVLVVDEQDIAADNTLKVYVVDERGDEALVDLPRDTFSSGSRVRVPSSVLLPA